MGIGRNEIGAPASRHDGLHDLRPQCGRRESSCCAGARAEKTDAETGRRVEARYPVRQRDDTAYRYTADPVSLAWSFDDGGSVPGAGVKHAFAKPGIHVATIKATDAAGVTSTKTVLVAATAGPVPVLSALALVPKKFRPAKGTDVRFKLSAGAPVRFTVERRGAGRKVGGKCRATTKKNRHAKKCTRYVSMKGSFVRNGVSGANHFHWKGRLKGKALKPGGYRLTGAVGSGLTKRLRRSGFTIKR